MNRFLTVLLISSLLALATLPARAQDDLEQAACLAFDRAACSAVLARDPGNLTAYFMRGLAAELDGDHQPARDDFAQAVQREPRHFGAQLWLHVAIRSLGQSDRGAFAAWLSQSSLPPWPKALGLHYFGSVSTTDLIALAEAQPAAARSEALCAAYYHIGRAAHLAGDSDAAMIAYRAALATGATHVFEFRAAERALQGNP